MSGAGPQGAAAAGVATAAPAGGEGDAASALGADGEQTLPAGRGEQTFLNFDRGGATESRADCGWGFCC